MLPSLHPSPDLPTSSSASRKAPTNWSRLWPLLVAPLLPSCLGDQFGGSNNGGDETSCVVTKRTFDLDVMTPMGFRGRDILDFAAATFEVPFGLSADEDHPSIVVVPEGDTTLHLTIESSEESVTYVDRELGPDSSEGTDCLDSLEIEAEATLLTDNGAFDDTLPVVLRAGHMLSVETTLELEPGAMQGTFDLVPDEELTAGTRWELERTRLELHLGPGHASGTLMAWYDVTQAGGEQATALVDVWRTADGSHAACYTEDFGSPLDDGEAVSRLRALLDDTPRLAVTFTKGDATDVELDVAIEADPAFCLGGNASPSLHFSGRLVLTRADDGEPFATWPMGGYARYTPEGRFEIIKMSGITYLYQPFDAEEVEASLGDFGHDFSASDDAAVGFWLDRESSGGWHGTLHLEEELAAVAEATLTELE